MSTNILTNIPISLPSFATDMNRNYGYSDGCNNNIYRMEKERLKTFKDWPLEWLDKKALATTGMVYTGDEDKTKCIFCEVIIGKWELDDDPVEEHLRWSPHCPLLNRRLTDNEPLNEVTLDLLLPSIQNTYDTPPLPKWKTEPRTDYSLEEVRLQTFANWPRSMKQRPEALAEAGFYYKGSGDCVTCFSCLGGLKDWEENDDPWEQHALWMGHYCEYVKLMMGKDYIKSVKDNFEKQPHKKSEVVKESKQLMRHESTDSAEDKLCKICFDHECNTVFIPCGHVVTCVGCALAVKECPVCRKTIERTVRLYFS